MQVSLCICPKKEKLDTNLDYTIHKALDSLWCKDGSEPPDNVKVLVVLHDGTASTSTYNDVQKIFHIENGDRFVGLRDVKQWVVV